ncbi:hypothetical protein ABZ657_26965, partial [Streptomyces sp. NPDC007000]
GTGRAGDAGRAPDADDTGSLRTGTHRTDGSRMNRDGAAHARQTHRTGPPPETTPPAPTTRTTPVTPTAPAASAPAGAA